MEVPKIPITLDKPRTLFYPMPSLFALADAPFGENRINPTEEEIRDFPERVNSESMKDKFQRLSTRLWAGLIHEDRTLTVEQVSWMLHAGNLEEAAILTDKAMSAILELRMAKEANGEAAPLAAAVVA